MEPLTRLESKEALSALEDIVIQRRATLHFTDEPVPAEVVDTALSIATQAPSGYNLQPWRFLVLTEPARRHKLQAAAFGQETIGEAPLIIVAMAQREGWKARVDDIFRTRATRTDQEDSALINRDKQAALNFVATLPPAVWLNRQVMTAFTYLLLAFEFQGWDTAPMESFDGPAIRRALELPEDTEVVALLAVGRARNPDPPHPGRLPVSEIAHRERFGEPYVSNDSEL